MQRKLHPILESLVDPIIAADNDFVITSFNKRATAMFGWTATEVVGKSITFLFPTHPTDLPDDVKSTLMEARHKRGTMFNVVAQITRDPQATMVIWTLLFVQLPPVMEFNIHASGQLNQKLSVDDLDTRHRRVLLRVDYNVPLTMDAATGERVVRDDFRIKVTIPTISKLMKDGAKVIIMSHMGRPKGKVVPELSLAPVRKRLEQLVGKSILWCPNCLEAKPIINKMKAGEVLLLENVRFHNGEETKNEEERTVFAKHLAKYGEIYVSDAFGAVHRESATMTVIPRYMAHGVAGYVMQREVTFLSQAVISPPKPLVAIVGGAKVSDKIQLLSNLFLHANTVIIGGAMAFTFLEAMGHQMGNSKVERVARVKGKEIDLLTVARDLMARAKAQSVDIILPTDHSCAATFADAEPTITKTADVPDTMMALDFGPNTIKSCVEVLKSARCVIWNGPVGVFEFPHFATGTNTLAATITSVPEILSIVGGGDTAAAVRKYAKKFSHVSTGGGATLELLEGKALPGLVCLSNRAVPKL